MVARAPAGGELSVAGREGKRVRVLLVHGRRLLGDVLRASLEERRDVELVAVAAGAGEALAALAGDNGEGRGADLVLVDAAAGCEAALAAVRELADRLPSTRILPFGLAGCDDAVRFIEAGASGYATDGASLDELLDEARRLAGERASCAPEVAARVVERIVELTAAAEPPPVTSPGLTPREQEVLELVADGLANKEIAGCLGISLSTVKNHVHSLLDKLEAKRRREAVRIAYRLGLIDDFLPRR
ncbi:MAG TPA: response regulator transcription factor, partial [Thermoanaerobaculia bacterium]|nr:response regulator transcription factor [Thermoanaerobaculia bacterium]